MNKYFSKFSDKYPDSRKVFDITIFFMVVPSLIHLFTGKKVYGLFETSYQGFSIELLLFILTLVIVALIYDLKRLRSIKSTPKE